MLGILSDINEAVFQQENPSFSVSENQTTIGNLFATDPEVKGIQSISAFDHSLFVDENGSLWAMGNNVSGQLGDGTNIDKSSPVLVVDGNVTITTAGFSHSLFIKQDGSLWGMGANDRGQLGDGTSATNLPVKIVDSGVTRVSAVNFTIFLKSDGSLWGMD